MIDIDLMRDMQDHTLFNSDGFVMPSAEDMFIYVGYTLLMLLVAIPLAGIVVLLSNFVAFLVKPKDGSYVPMKNSNLADALTIAPFAIAIIIGLVVVGTGIYRDSQSHQVAGQERLRGLDVISDSIADTYDVDSVDVNKQRNVDRIGLGSGFTGLVTAIDQDDPDVLPTVTVTHDGNSYVYTVKFNNDTGDVELYNSIRPGNHPDPDTLLRDN